MLKDVLIGTSLAFFILGMLAASAYVSLMAFIRWIKDTDPDTKDRDAFTGFVL
jgi:hypothetical protein